MIKQKDEALIQITCHFPPPSLQSKGLSKALAPNQSAVPPDFSPLRATGSILPKTKLCIEIKSGKVGYLLQRVRNCLLFKNLF